MRVGIDVQVIAGGNRSGLYSCLRSTINELRPLVDDQLWLFARADGGGTPSEAESLSAAMDGAKVQLIGGVSRFHQLLNRSLWNRVDVLLHNLHGRLPRATRAANAYLVPDVIPLAIDYGVAGFADNYIPFYEAAARHGDVILVFTEHAKQDFLNRVGGRADLVRVAPLAAGDEFRPAPDASLLRATLREFGLADVPYVLMVATLELRKNHAVLLRAFARLLERDPALRHQLVLVGGKWIGHEAVFDLIRELRLEDRVKYLGFADQLPALYAGADCFVFPSLYEGFGLPVLEAMACGVPVLAADATSLPEVVGDAGVLFPPHDVDGLTDALHEMLTNHCRREEFRERSLKQAAMFSWRRTAQLYLEAFEFGRRRFES